MSVPYPEVKGNSMDRFYWLYDGALAGCSRPGRSGDLDRDLDTLREEGIGAVLTLTERPLLEDALDRHGIEALHVPVPDMDAPLPGQFMEALEFIDRHRSAGKTVAVHCLVGQGRTATMLAAYLIREGASADEAIARLRLLCPGAIPSTAQETALSAFAQRRDWIV